LADVDGSHVQRVETAQPFSFVPQRSPHGAWLLFLCGEHYNCHPHVIRADGAKQRKLADRRSYRGVVEFLDVPDFHGGSSDLPVWSADGRSAFCTAQVGESVELFQTTFDGKSEQLTKSTNGVLHYHLQPSPDGRWLVYGSKRDGVRQLFVMRLADRSERRITNLTAGRGAMWPHWQPITSARE
jgi:Tol biopolymer transport system component